jgi:hypothetical protein
MLMEVLLALAIRQVNPSLPDDRTYRYAAWVLRDAKNHNLDPWIYVAIAGRETRWTTGITRYEFDGSCSVGLGQINVPCNSPDLVPLLDARSNIRRMGVFFDRIRKECRHDCTDLGWLRAYNPGDHVYFAAVRDAVRTYDAKASQSAVLRVPPRVHTSKLPRQEGSRAVHERRLAARDDNSRGPDGP